MKQGSLKNLDWQKGDGLMPAIVQNARDGTVLMLAYMNAEALAATMGLLATAYTETFGRPW